MKLIYPFILVQFFTQVLYAQKHTEYSITAGTGFFKYAGTDFTYIEPYYSMMNAGTTAATAGGSGYINWPYGNKPGTSYFASLGLKRVTKHNFLWNFELSYESLQSKKNVVGIYDGWNLYPTLGGSCSLTNRYITVSPSYGHRFFIKKIKHLYYDITGGLDIAMNFFNTHEKAFAITASNNLVVEDNTSRSVIGFTPFDVRAKLQALIGYKKFGIVVGYSWGFFTGIHGYYSPPPHQIANSRFLKLGLSYQLKSTKNKKPHNS